MRTDRKSRGRVWQSLLITFSMYSKIPMPRAEWTQENMKYCMAFFPLVGAVCGAAAAGLYHLGRMAGVGNLLLAVLLTVLPVAFSGGIHMDGLMDTMDARHSYQPKDRKLEILKDSRAGAFAVLGCCGYLLIYAALWQELLGAGAAGRKVWILAVGMVLERVLSGLSVVCFPSAYGGGTAAGFQKAAGKRVVRGILLLWAAACGACLLLLDWKTGGLALAAALGIFVYYDRMSRKEFGGITGDLAGYFLQLCELAILASCTVSVWLGW